MDWRTSTFSTARTGDWQFPGRPTDVEEPSRWEKKVRICITELTGIDDIGLGIELELPSSELELNCLKDFVPDSELNWNCYYWNWIAKTELTPALMSATVDVGCQATDICFIHCKLKKCSVAVTKTVATQAQLHRVSDREMKLNCDDTCMYILISVAISSAESNGSFMASRLMSLVF